MRFTLYSVLMVGGQHTFALIDSLLSNSHNVHLLLCYGTSTGAGKSTIMNILASHVTPEHGDIALGGIVCTDRDLDTDHLYCNGNVSFCPQFDALFPRKSVDEHLKFYAAIRGLDWDADATQNHV